MDLQKIELTFTPEIMSGLQRESDFTGTTIEGVITTILESVLFDKIGKPRITGPVNIGGQPLKKVTGPTTTNWK